MSLLQKFIKRFCPRQAQSGYKQTDADEAATVYDSGSSGSVTQEAQPSNPDKFPRRKPYQPGELIEDFKDGNKYPPAVELPVSQPSNLSFGQPVQGPTSGIGPRDQLEVSNPPKRERFMGFDWPQRFWPEDEFRKPVPPRKQKIDWFSVQDGAGSQVMTVEQVKRFSKKIATSMEDFGVHNIDRKLFFSRLLLGER
jgi:hypothetical protein